MKSKLILLTLIFISTITLAENAKQTEQVYKLSYLEKEPGIDEYEVTLLISPRYIRIDEKGEDSGFIVYDDQEKIIYSVSHYDQSVLVIHQHAFTTEQRPVKSTIEYLQLADAPKVSGKIIFNYRNFIRIDGGDEETCMEVQLVEDLLPEVRGIMQNYQKIVSGQQVKMTDNKITDIQTGCYYVDQIYNTGAYYEKGLPIHEWHSNDRSKVLTGYEKILIKTDKFTIPKNYRQFSIDVNAKSYIK